MTYLVTLRNGDSFRYALVTAWHMQEAREIAADRFPGWIIVEVE